jgi:hypothetical protein
MELVSSMQSDAERIPCKLIAAKITKVLKDDRSQSDPKESPQRVKRDADS